jgi:hypothetical protein
MTKRSFLLTAAAGLLASIAFAAPSHAGSVLIEFSVTGGTATDVQLDYLANTTVTVLAGSNPTAAEITPIDGQGTTFITLNFAARSTGTIYLSDGPGAPPILYGLSGLSPGYKSSTITVTPYASVPEPTSFALLGIGMTGFLAFRRLFKRNSVA